jgi:LysM repeat protein
MKRVVGVLLGLIMLLVLFTPAMAASNSCCGGWGTCWQPCTGSCWQPCTYACPSADWEILGTHTVKTGESLYCIGRAYGVDPHAIACENGIVCANVIYPGTILRIPNAPRTLPEGPICERQFDVEPDDEQPEVVRCGPDECTCDSKHVVKSGETLTTLAIHYNVPMWDLAHCNCIYNLNYIWVGTELCIPPSQ